VLQAGKQETGKAKDLSAPLSTKFSLSRWLIVVVNSVIGLLHSVDTGRIADVSEVHAVSIFSITLLDYKAS
jgi:hypothetical protein